MNRKGRGCAREERYKERGEKSEGGKIRRRPNSFPRIPIMNAYPNPSLLCQIPSPYLGRCTSVVVVAVVIAAVARSPSDQAPQTLSCSVRARHIPPSDALMRYYASVAGSHRPTALLVRVRKQDVSHTISFLSWLTQSTSSLGW